MSAPESLHTVGILVARRKSHSESVKRAGSDRAPVAGSDSAGNRRRCSRSSRPGQPRLVVNAPIDITASGTRRSISAGHRHAARLGSRVPAITARTTVTRASLAMTNENCFPQGSVSALLSAFSGAGEVTSCGHPPGPRPHSAATSTANARTRSATPETVPVLPDDVRDERGGDGDDRDDGAGSDEELGGALTHGGSFEKTQQGRIPAIGARRAAFFRAEVVWLAICAGMRSPISCFGCLMERRPRSRVASLVLVCSQLSGQKDSFGRVGSVRGRTGERRLPFVTPRSTPGIHRSKNAGMRESADSRMILQESSSLPRGRR